MNSACAISSKKLYTTQSSNKKINVEIIQKNFLIENRAYLSAYLNDGKFVNEKLLYTGDFFDDDFLGKYPEYFWAENSMLKIGRNAKNSDSKFENIKITNSSLNRINYILIETAKDKVILFAVEPNSAFELRFPIAEWLSCQGVFADTKKRFGYKVIIPKNKKTNQFEIKIKDEVEIISPQIELEKSNCCAPDRNSFDRENELF